jgi:hypothetical protein
MKAVLKNKDGQEKHTQERIKHYELDKEIENIEERDEVLIAADKTDTDVETPPV